MPSKQLDSGKSPRFAQPATFMRLPHQVDLGGLCGTAGAGHERVGRASDLLPALDRAAGAGGLNVVEIIVDAELGLRRRAELRDAVDTALAAM